MQLVSSVEETLSIPIRHGISETLDTIPTLTQMIAQDFTVNARNYTWIFIKFNIDEFSLKFVILSNFG
jgi:hypothetical protein